VTLEELAGRELRRLRTAAGWSQEEVARRMDAYGYRAHQTTIAKIESADRPLRLNELADLCDLFGVTPAGLLKMAPDTSAADNARLRGKLARIREVLDADDG
jgi:transcriptional regulator with XRE-family HTH domain